MSFKPVDLDKTGLRKEIEAEMRVKRLEDGNVELPTKKLYVCDMEFDPFTGDYTRVKVLGEIEYPLDFCTMDSGACSQGTGPDGFYHMGGMDADGKMHPELWIHSCYRPTRRWFTTHVKSLVKFYDNVQLPW